MPANTKIRALGEFLFIAFSLPVCVLAFAIFITYTNLLPPIFSPLGVWLVVMLIRILFEKNGLSWKDIGLSQPQNLAATVVYAIAFCLVVLPLISLIIEALATAGAPRPDVSAFESLQGNTVLYLLFMLFVVWGSAAVGEEIIARGFLFRRFEDVLGGQQVPWIWPCLAQALVFGAAHLYQGFTGFVITSLAGFFLGILFVFTGRNLWAPILAHGLVDTISVTLLYWGVDP